MTRYQNLHLSDKSLFLQYRNLFKTNITSAHGILENSQLQNKFEDADTFNELSTGISDLENDYYENVPIKLAELLADRNNSINDIQDLGQYDNTREYVKNNLVVYNNELYYCKQTSLGNLPTNTTYWVYLGLTGEKGASSLGVNLKGNWQWDAQSTSGTFIHVDNAVEKELKTLDFVGDTKQNSTTGKNKLNPNKFTPTTNFPSINAITSEVTINVNDAQSVAYIFDNLAIPGGQYVVHCEVVSGTYTGGNLLFYDLNDSKYEVEFAFRTSTEQYKTIQLTEGLKKLGIWQSKATSEVKLKIWIEPGSSSTSFEPYTGGIASPNPDYPQLINNVKSDNGILNWTKTGKNLFDKDNLRENYVVNSSGVIVASNLWNTINSYIKSNGTITISAKTTSEINILIAEYDNSKTFIKRNQVSTSTLTSLSRTIALNSNTKYLIVSYRYDLGTSEIQLEQGSTATTYEPYKSVSIPFNIGSTEFCKLPNGVADKLWVNLRTGEYGKIANVGKVVLNGSENIVYYDAPSVAKANEFETAYFAIAMTNYVNGKNLYSNYFGTPYNTADEIWGTASSIALQSGIYQDIRLRVRILKSVLTGWNNDLTSEQKIALFKTWLSTHNTEVLYELATPVTTTLGTLSKENLAKLVMFEGVNNLELTGYDDNGAEPIIEIEYYKNTSSINYLQKDVVAYENFLWVAKDNNVGEIPYEGSAHWQKLIDYEQRKINLDDTNLSVGDIYWEEI